LLFPLACERKTSYLEDIAILTGGQLVKDELGITLDKADESVLGLAAKVVVGKESCTIVGDGRTQVRVCVVVCSQTG
jgi:chaperonin GroEL